MKHALISDVHGGQCASQGLPDNRLRTGSATKPVGVR